jgi:SAM-dependent methyltransferase
VVTSELTRADTAKPSPRPPAPQLEALLSSRLQRYILFDRINRSYLRWQAEQFNKFLGQRVLEIGCGVGGIINQLKPRELIYGLDVEQDVLDYAAERFKDRPECKFALLDINNTSPERFAELQAERFDSIVCINVLEHIKDDVAALRRMESLLQPGGTLALLVPAHMALYGAYDKLDGHYRRYSKAYFRKIVAQTSLKVRKLRYFNFLGAMGWWVQYKLLKRTIHGEGQFGIMNYALPVVRLLEKLCPPPFGLSLVTVCQKPV